MWIIQIVTVVLLMAVDGAIRKETVWFVVLRLIDLGYCFAKTGSPSGATLCGGLAGTWKTSCTNSSSGTGTVSEYGTVDPKAKCEQFQGSQCIGTVFYDGRRKLVGSNECSVCKCNVWTE